MWLKLKTINNIPLYYNEQEIQEKLLECETLLKKVETYNIPKDYVLLDAFSSATIEGARTTIEKVKSSVHTKDEVMVVNTLKVQKELYNSILSNSNIRQIWEVLVKDVCENCSKRGTKYRDGRVFVGDTLGNVVHEPPKHTELESYMTCLFNFIYDKQFNTILNAIIGHFYFVYIHPFCDGNGRLARILQNSIINQKYSGVRRISISKAINSHLNDYYKALSKCEKPVIINDIVAFDITCFIKYMLDCIIEACNTAECKQYKLNIEEYKLISKMSKRGIGSNISVKACAKLLKCDEKHSRYVLNKLCNKGFLLKLNSKETNKRIYVLRILIK